jgi:hypothetical protein
VRTINVRRAAFFAVLFAVIGVWAAYHLIAASGFTENPASVAGRWHIMLMLGAMGTTQLFLGMMSLTDEPPRRSGGAISAVAA